MQFVLTANDTILLKTFANAQSNQLMKGLINSTYTMLGLDDATIVAKLVYLAENGWSEKVEFLPDSKKLGNLIKYNSQGIFAFFSESAIEDPTVELFYRGEPVDFEKVARLVVVNCAKQFLEHCDSGMFLTYTEGLEAGITISPMDFSQVS